MIKHGKKYQKAREHLDKSRTVTVDAALAKVKESAYVKFDESVDLDISLGIDPSKGDQIVRGSVILPHGSGKRAQVLVFAKGDHAEEAKKAGADYVGAEDLIEKISGGWLDFDYAIATPDLMGLIGKVARVLGPRGLLPNKKVGTVTENVASVIQELKKGRVFFKNDKGGAVHISIGKVSFDPKALHQNLTAFIKALVASKPPASKGRFIKKITLSSTMGVGIPLSCEEVL